MSGMQAFFPTAQAPEGERVVSARYTDESGAPIPFRARAIDARRNDALKRSITRVENVRGLCHEVMDSERYTAELVAACVVYPDLLDAELQERHGVKTAPDLVRAMLLPGEYATLSEWIMELNGYDAEPETLITAAKN